VHAHLDRWALPETIKERPLISCGECGCEATEQMLDMLEERGQYSYQCPICRSLVSLPGSAKSPAADLSVVSEMDRAADASRDEETAVSILEGKRATKNFDVFLCHNRIDKPLVIQIGERLKFKGILPWLDQWEIAPGQRWQRELDKAIKNVRSAAVFLGRDG